MMNDPRDEMRRILNRPSEPSYQAPAKQNSNWLDAIFDLSGRVYVSQGNSTTETGTCLSGMLKIATDALDAAGSILDD